MHALLAAIALFAAHAPAAHSPAVRRVVATPAKKKPALYVGKPKTPGLVRAFRVVFNEEFSIRAKGGIAAPLRKKFAHLMRAGDGSTKSIDMRLMQLIVKVSDHFGGKKLEVVSGFRPKTPTQFTPHSRHNMGNAIDFRIVGVPNTVVRDYCRSLKNTGCGYYPNSSFVHMDTRSSSAYWIDYSGPGEKPRYHPPDPNEGTTSGGEDEGAGEVDVPSETSDVVSAHMTKTPEKQGSDNGQAKAEALPKADDAPAQP